MFNLGTERDSGQQKRNDTLDSQKLLASQLLFYGFRILGPIVQSGRFSDIYKGLNRQGRMVAIKAHKASIEGRSWMAEGIFNQTASEKNISPDCFGQLTIVEGGYLGVSIIDWVVGSSLQTIIAQCSHRHRVDQAVVLAGELVRRERELQNLGILQADKKPENLIGRTVSSLQVIDYGISYWHHDLGDYKEIHGTPSYMTKDQLTGNLRPTSDQEAIFYILYEMLTGKRMFPERFGKQKLATIEVYNRRFLTPDPHHDPWKVLALGYGEAKTHQLHTTLEMLTDPIEQDDPNLLERFLVSFLRIFPHKKLK